MEIVGFNQGTAVTIPCCLCGTLIHPNDANQCGTCLAQQFDLKSILQRGPGGGTLTINQCRECRRYEQTPNFYAHHDPESPTLLAVLLKKIPALSSSSSNYHKDDNNISMKLIDSCWIWTEPHSMRFKLRLTVHADVSEPYVKVQQRLPVEFLVKWGQCPDCNRNYTNRTWHAIVQVRQKRDGGSNVGGGGCGGLEKLEHAIAKDHNIRKQILRVDTVRNGFDFYFLHQHHAQTFVSFVGKTVPIRFRNSSKLVSEDIRNNEHHLKYTTVCDLVPLGRWDLLAVDKRGGRDGAGGMAGRLCLVERISNGLIRLVDGSPGRGKCPVSNREMGSLGGGGRFADLHPEKYWRGEKHYRVVLDSRRLVRFVVLDVELLHSSNSIYSNNTEILTTTTTTTTTTTEEEGCQDDERSLYNGPKSGIPKYTMADIEVARESDFGVTNETFHVTTAHLGNLLQTGDVVLGYDLVTSVYDDEVMLSSFNKGFVMPDVVLVKKAKVGASDVIGEDGGSTTTTATEEDSKKEGRAKSGRSKKRERRQRRYEKKARALEETVMRMGFGEKDEEEEEKVALQREMQDDDKNLADELDVAENLLEANHTAMEQSESPR